MGAHLFECGSGTHAWHEASEADAELQFGAGSLMFAEAGATKLRGCSLDGFRPVELQLQHASLEHTRDRELSAASRKPPVKPTRTALQHQSMVFWRREDNKLWSSQHTR